ncbi:MAG: glutathione S-transferase family protein [Gammaproteobacteria bacterium]
MKLIITPTSPFARKARILIAEKGLECQTETAMPWDDAPSITDNNPLRKVPILLTDIGTITGSTLICEYLDALSPPHFLPSDFAARMAVKARDEIAQGGLESATAVLMAGRVAPAMKDDNWQEWLLTKTRKAITHFEDESGDGKTGGGKSRIGDAENPDMADITLACFLDFITLRMPKMEWQTANPKLSEWFNKIKTRPSLTQTAPPAA